MEVKKPDHHHTWKQSSVGKDWGKYNVEAGMNGGGGGSTCLLVCYTSIVEYYIVQKVCFSKKKKN